MRSQFVDILLRESEEPDYEGMFAAAALDIKWTKVGHSTYRVEFVPYVLDSVMRWLELDFFRIPGTNTLVTDIIFYGDAETQPGFHKVKTYRFIDASAITLKKAKRVTEAWIKNDWCKSFYTKEEVSTKLDRLMNLLV